MSASVPSRKRPPRARIVQGPAYHGRGAAKEARVRGRRRTWIIFVIAFAWFVGIDFGRERLNARLGLRIPQVGPQVALGGYFAVLAFIFLPRVLWRRLRRWEIARAALPDRDTTLIHNRVRLPQPWRYGLVGLGEVRVGEASQGTLRRLERIRRLAGDLPAQALAARAPGEPSRAVLPNAWSGPRPAKPGPSVWRRLGRRLLPVVLLWAAFLVAFWLLSP